MIYGQKDGCSKQVRYMQTLLGRRKILQVHDDDDRGRFFDLLKAQIKCLFLHQLNSTQSLWRGFQIARGGVASAILSGNFQSGSLFQCICIRELAKCKSKLFVFACNRRRRRRRLVT